MTQSWFRLNTNPEHLFSGHQIDRAKPISFEINGNPVSGFSGDTVLSALLASGFGSAGMHYGAPLTLSETLGLAVTVNGDQAIAFPIDRIPAQNGARYVTVGHTAPDGHLTRLMKLFSGQKTSLDLNFPDGQSATQTTASTHSSSESDYDLVVVGAGLAGLSAAARAVELGQSVALIERCPYLGGIAALFGHAAGEEPPENAIARLHEIVLAGGVKIVTSADVFDIGHGKVMADVITTHSGQPIRQTVQFNAPNVVLATGAADRLPIFSGNRLPGTVALSTLYELASAYALWPGIDTLLATTGNAGYRLALLAADANAPIGKIIDNRLEPQSRFIEFAKAYGIKFAFAERISSASFDPKSQDLTIISELAFADQSKRRDAMRASALILSGGWMPRLNLWRKAGGAISQNEISGLLQADDRLKGVLLAGAAAGYQSAAAVLTSGQLAADPSKKSRAIKEHIIDPKFETPDGIFPVASQPAGDSTTYLSNSASLATANHGAAKTLFRTPSHPPAIVEIEDVALSIADCLAIGALGVLPAAEFPVIANERLIHDQNSIIEPTSSPVEISQEISFIPAYLAARFGLKPKLWQIECDSGQTFEIGDLLYPNSDISDPELAAGIVLSTQGQSRAIALVSAEYAEQGRRLFARSVRRQLWATLATPVAKAEQI